MGLTTALGQTESVLFPSPRLQRNNGSVLWNERRGGGGGGRRRRRRERRRRGGGGGGGGGGRGRGNGIKQGRGIRVEEKDNQGKKEEKRAKRTRERESSNTFPIHKNLYCYLSKEFQTRIEVKAMLLRQSRDEIRPFAVRKQRVLLAPWFTGLAKSLLIAARMCVC